MKNSKLNLVMGSALLAMTIAASPASAKMSKDDIKSQAVELCQSQAVSLYGEESLKKIAKKARWNGKLKGAVVKVKLKKKSRAKNYNCLVDAEQNVKFLAV